MSMCFVCSYWKLIKTLFKKKKYLTYCIFNRKDNRLAIRQHGSVTYCKNMLYQTASFSCSPQARSLCMCPASCVYVCCERLQGGDQRLHVETHFANGDRIRQRQPSPEGDRISQCEPSLERGSRLTKTPRPPFRRTGESSTHFSSSTAAFPKREPSSSIITVIITLLIHGKEVVSVKLWWYIHMIVVTVIFQTSMLKV